MKKIVLGLLLGWLALQAQAADINWTTDFAAAQKKAKDEKKLVLMDFTGSDWCGWCIKLNKEVFSTKEFSDYAKDNLVMVEVDFPRRKQLSDEQKKANEKLQAKYGAEGFPTIIVLNSEGKQVWKQVGYMQGGTKAWIAKLDEAKQKK